MQRIHHQILPFAFCVLLGIPSLAQGPGGRGMPAYASRPAIGSIKGMVNDSLTGEPVEFATISVFLASNDSLVTGGITDSKGRFLIEEVRPGMHRLQIDFMGFKRKSVPMLRVSPRSPVVDAGTIGLTATAQALDAVEISAERQFVANSIDKKVYSVEKNAVSEGGSATEVLQNVPSVDVDIDGNVSLRGSENVTILIDGKPSGLTGTSRQAVLEQIPASSIESIEIITNPSAKYDPDGMSGIINVILKKNKLRGFNGTLSLNAGNRNKYNGSLNVNWRSKKVNVFASYSARYDQRWRKGESTRTTSFNDSIATLDQYSYSDGISQSQLFKGGADFYLNDKNTLSFSGTLSQRLQDSEGSVNYTNLQGETTVTDRYIRETIDNGNGDSYDLNLTFDHSFKQPQHKLTLSANYSDGGDYGLSDYEQYFTDFSFRQTEYPAGIQQHTITDDNSTFTVLQADYVYPFKKDYKIEAGYKSTLRDINSDFYSESWDAGLNALVPDTGLINDYQYKEDIHAIYGIYQGKFKGYGYQVGLRAEQAYTTANQKTTNEVFRNDYFNLFPTVHIARKLEKNQEVRASYSRRINRPRSRMLNPFPSQSDPFNIRRGNPELLPEYIDNYELSYARYWEKGHSVTAAVYYRPIHDVIRRIRVVDSTGVSVTTSQNLSSGTNSGIELVSTAQLAEWWTATVSFNGYRTVIDGSNLSEAGDLSNDAWAWTSKLNSMMRFKKDWQLQVSARYRSAGVHSQGDFFPMFTADVAVKKSVLKKKGSVTVRLSDASNTRRWKFNSMGPGFEQVVVHKRESRILFVGFTYRFGKQTQQGKRSRRQGDGPSDGEPDDM